jgi:Flp pilus assembly protein TadD
MAKPMMVTLPLILLVLDFWPLGRMLNVSAQNRNVSGDIRPASPRQLILEKIPLFMLTAVSCAVTYSIQQKNAAVTDLNVLPMTHRITNALVSYIMYLVKTAWPHPLAVLYPHPAGGVPVWMWILCLLLLASGTWLILANARKQSWFVTGWLWYGITLVPVIGLVQVGSQAMADRYTYLPSVGISIMLAWAAAKFSSPWPARKIILSVLSGLLAAGMILGTRNQVAFWKDTETLYMHTLNVTRNNDLIHCYLGIFLSEQNRTEQAETHFRQALDINPQNYLACDNLAASLWKRGNFREAIDLYYQILNIGPEDTTSLNNLSWYLSTASQEQLRNPSEAIRLAQKACQLTSFQAPDILDTLAVAYASAGRFQEAIQTAKQAVGLAQAANQTELADEISRKLKLYEAGKTGIDPSGEKIQQRPLPSP